MVLKRIPITFDLVGTITKLGRAFDGLLDDVRIWGRPLSGAEVAKLWGNGMGDFGPEARFEIESPIWAMNSVVSFVSTRGY